MDGKRNPGGDAERLSRPLRMAVREQGDVRVAALSGSSQLDQSESVRQGLPALVGAKNRWLVVDLREVDFMGSPLVAGIMAAAKRARADGGDVSIAEPRPEIARLLRIAQLDKLVSVESDVGRAIELLQARSAAAPPA